MSAWFAMGSIGPAGGSVGIGRHVVIVRAMTDASGGSPVSGSSARPSDVLVSVRSALAVMSLLALTVLMLEIARHSERVIAWVLVAGALAVLVYPVVQFGSRWLPRGLVVSLLVIVGLSAIGFVSYRLVNDVTQATDRLQQAAPRRAAQLEKNSDLLRQVHLSAGVKEPRRRHPEAAHRRIGHEGARVGGDPRRRVRGRARSSRSSSCSTDRGSSSAASIRSAIRGAGTRRARGHAGTRRGLDYARIKVLEALVEGVLAYVIARGRRSRSGRARRVGRAVDAAAGRGRVRGRAPDRVVRGRVVADARGRGRARVRRDRHGRVPLHVDRGTRDRGGRVVPDRVRGLRRAGARRASPARCSACSA